MAHDRQPEKYQNKRPSDPSHPDELRQLTMSESKPKKGKSNCFSISSISFALQSFSLLFIGSFILSICSSVYQSVYWYPSPSYPILPCPILFCPVLSNPILSHSILCFVLSCPVLSCSCSNPKDERSIKSSRMNNFRPKKKSKLYSAWHLQ